MMGNGGGVGREGGGNYRVTSRLQSTGQILSRFSQNGSFADLRDRYSMLSID